MPATQRATELAIVAARAASDLKAEEIIALDVSEQLVLTDVFLIASASNERQVVAIVDAVEEAMHKAGAKALRREVHLVLRQVSHDFERMQYNTVVSAVMKMMNALEAAPTPETPEDQAALAECFGIALRVLYPVCPHISYQIWQEAGYSARYGNLLDAAWPEVDANALVQDEIELMLQINGKLRGSILVPATADQAAIEALALASEAFAKHATPGQQAKKVIVVPKRLVNVVL